MADIVNQYQYTVGTVPTVPYRTLLTKVIEVLTLQLKDSDPEFSCISIMFLQIMYNTKKFLYAF